MLDELATIYTLRLRYVLGKKVKGFIKAYILNDILYVDITYNHIYFTYSNSEIFSSIMDGVTADTMALCVFKKYRYFISRKFFV